MTSEKKVAKNDFYVFIPEADKIPKNIREAIVRTSEFVSHILKLRSQPKVLEEILDDVTNQCIFLISGGPLFCLKRNEDFLIEFLLYITTDDTCLIAYIHQELFGMVTNFISQKYKSRITMFKDFM